MSAFLAAAACTSSGRTCGAGGSLSATASGKLHPRHRRPHEPLREDALAELGHDEVQPELAGVGIRALLHQADAVGRGGRGFLRDHDRDRVAEPVGVLGLEAVVLVGDPDRDLAFHELRVRRRAQDAQHVSRLVQLAQVVEPGLHVVHVAAAGEVGREDEHLADAGRTRVEVDDRVPVLGLEQIVPGLRHVLDQLGVDDERDRERMDGEPPAVGLAEHRRQLVEVHRLERRDHPLLRRIDAGGGEVVRGVGLRTVARLLERDHGRRRAEVVVDDLDVGVAPLERGELRRPVRPRRAGVEADHHALLLRRLVERLLARVQLRRVDARSATTRSPPGRAHRRLPASASCVS